MAIFPTFFLLSNRCSAAVLIASISAEGGSPNWAKQPTNNDKNTRPVNVNMTQHDRMVHSHGLTPALLILVVMVVVVVVVGAVALVFQSK